jgi:ATP-dependent protease HslVU (ClpYQ) peptidase subunit
MKTTRFLFYLTIGSSLASVALGCLWDGDTLEAERARFPNALEIITGHFPRHSKEFHEWRRKQREAAIKANPKDLPAYDDLAVSLHKLGRNEDAIDIMKAKEAIKPGLYETLSNLGTFYIYVGNLNSAEECIRKALVINPNAHFGREKYQLYLIQWLKANGPTSRGEPDIAFKGTEGFARFVMLKERKLADDSSSTLEISQDERIAALRGVLGMMLFADHDNPVLLEAAGDLFEAGRMKENGAYLAGLAYKLGASVAKDDETRKRLEPLAEKALITANGAAKIDQQLTDLLTASAKLQENIKADELAWIAEGKDVAAEFQKKYYKAK